MGRICHSNKGQVMLDSVKRFLQSEDGPTAVEYAVMLALIIIVCLTSIKGVGNVVWMQFNHMDYVLTDTNRIP